MENREVLLQEEKKNREKGFTLIELLVVIAIIAILAAIAIPQFTKYKKKAAIGAATSILATCVSEAAAQYADNSDTSYPCSDLNVDLTIDANTGVVSLNETTVTYKGYSFKCKVDNNKVECYE